MKQADKNGAATISLNDSGENLEVDVLAGTVGPDVLDIRKLYGQTGRFTYDPGFTATASCQSEITFIDGDLGKLLHRGYTIDELAEHSDYMEVCYLLLNGELPTADEKKKFTDTVTRHTMLHDQMNGFSAGSAGMRIRWQSWSALSVQ